MNPNWIEEERKTAREPFTEEESGIMELIVQAHNKFFALERTHPSEMGEWILSIHRLQDLMGMRVLIRDYPKTFFQGRQREPFLD